MDLYPDGGGRGDGMLMRNSGLPFLKVVKGEPKYPHKVRFVFKPLYIIKNNPLKDL